MKRISKVLILIVAFLIILGTLHFGATQVPAAAPKGVLKIELSTGILLLTGWTLP